MKLGLAEIIRMASEAPNHRARIEVLQRHDSQALRTIFKLLHEPPGQWDFDEGWKPAYTPNIYFDQESTLYQLLRNIGKFFVDGYPGLTREKKQLLFTQLLEQVDKDDAVLLIGVKNGKLPWKGLGPATIREAFPGLLSEKEEPVE